MPLHEKEKDREIEARLAKQLVPWLRVDHAKKMPMAHILDYAFVRGGKTEHEAKTPNEIGMFGEIELFGEVKARKLAYGYGEGYFVSLHKVIRAQSLYLATHKHSRLFVLFKGGEFMWTRLDVDVTRKTIWGGRYDRNDPNDLEPEAVIDWEDFRKVSI